jgi:polar amino acid transport system ATP-binding protein/sulfate transport system ATP-binding protein
MPALYPYSYAQTLLKIENVSLSASADGLRLLEKEEPGSHPILRGVNAEIRKIIRPGQVTGQVVGFIGPSGIGKTQLFRIIAGLNRPTVGQVTINGNTKPVEAGEVGVVAQSYPLFAHRSVMSNLMLSAKQIEKDPKVAHDKVMAFLTEFELDSKAHLYPSQLSGGQRQRIAILQQILCGEHFLLMDEPFSGLDLKTEEKCINLIMKVANMDDLNTVIVVTHDVTAAAVVSDHIWALGREFDQAGNPIPGSFIKFTYDLIERGLCWDQWGPQAQTRPALVEFVRELKADFYKL